MPKKTKKILVVRKFRTRYAAKKKCHFDQSDTRSVDSHGITCKDNPDPNDDQCRCPPQQQQDPPSPHTLPAQPYRPSDGQNAVLDQNGGGMMLKDGSDAHQIADDQEQTQVVTAQQYGRPTPEAVTLGSNLLESSMETRPESLNNLQARYLGTPTKNNRAASSPGGLIYIGKPPSLTHRNTGSSPQLSSGGSKKSSATMVEHQWLSQEQRIVNLYEELKRRCQDVTVLGFSFLSQAKFITFVKMYEHEAPAISISVRLKFNFALEIFVHEHLISKDHELFSVVSEKVDSIGKIKHVLNMVNSYYVCSGNHDTNLLGLVPLGKGLSCTPLEAVRAVHEQHISNTYNSTIRSVSCSLLIANNRCNSCKVIRKALLARLNRQSSVKSHQIDFTHYTKPNVFLTSPERWLKLRQFSDRNTELTKKVTRLEEKIEHYSKYCEALICNQGETLNESDNCDILQLAEDCQTTVSDQFPEGSFQRIFFQQQLKYNSLLNKTSMRWHPAIVRWCLYLKHKSAKAYEGVRAFLPLPSERTLFDYSNFLDTGTGFKTSVIQHFSEQAKLQTSTFVGILQDEIKVKSDLVYKKHSGELIGYTNLNMVSNELVDMEKTAASQTANLAEHLLVIMVRGVTSSFKYPLAAFATKSLTADILYSIMWETVEIVEVHAELKVLFFCCDGASQNRKFFNLHINSPGNNLEYKTVNPYDRSRYIYFISDVPHLLKTSRNCFSNSYSHKKSRKLWNNGKDISWMHVVRLYEETCENSEFKLCPKLTRNHIDLSSFSKMKVSLATQVFSATVANALELKYKDEVSGTTKFIRIMNKWFDLMNTKNVLESHKKRNSDLAPFSNASDDRLKWLLGEFLDYFENWEKSVSQYSHGNLSKDDRSKMLLSKQTIHGLRMTTMSVVECIKFLLQQGVPFVLTNHFNQDILEQHFGHYRHKGGHNDNPTVLEACHSLTNIRAVNFHGLAPKRGNITADEGGAAVMDCTPLKKRRP